MIDPLLSLFKKNSIFVPLETKSKKQSLFFISVLLLAGPLVALLTDFYVILPYRFVPLIAFFAIAIGVLIFKTTKSS